MISKMVSMPNISIGQARTSGGGGAAAGAGGDASAPDGTSPSEAELRARAAAAGQHGMPIAPHMLPGTLPFYPSLPVIDSELPPPTSPAYISAQVCPSLAIYLLFSDTIKYLSCEVFLWRTPYCKIFYTYRFRCKRQRNFV